MVNLIRYIGNKNKYLKHIEFPNEVNEYIEMFYGSGSICIYFLNKIKNGKIKLNGKIHVNDKNDILIDFHLCIKHNINEFIDNLKQVEKEFKNFNEIKEKKEYFKNKVKEFNEMNYCIFKSVLFYFLLFHSYKGIYSVLKNNEIKFYFDYKMNSIINEKIFLKMKEINELYNEFDINFYNMDYKIFLNKFSPKNKDLLICDSPYWIQKKHNVKYTNEYFTNDECIELYINILKYNCKFIIFNREIQKIKDIFIYHKIKIYKVSNGIYMMNKQNDMIVSN